MTNPSTPAPSNWSFLATCGFGLEKVLQGELWELGYVPRTVSPGFVQFEADAVAICRVNLWLRTADRVLVVMGQGEAEDFDALFEMARNASWEAWISAEDAMHVTGYSVRSQLSSAPAIQRTVKRGMVDRLMQVHNVHQLPETGAPFSVRVAIVANHAWLTLDTTGPSLHRRGYRHRYRKSDLKESLAAAIVLLTGWTRDQPLVDPFCGCGTIPIEAAMIGCRIAPGRQREFAAESWSTPSTVDWETARREADEGQLDDLPIRAVGIDADSRLIRQALEEAERAFVDDSVHFQVQSPEELGSRHAEGWVVTSPTWAAFDYEATGRIRSLPLALHRWGSWSHAILSDVPELESFFGRTADRRRKLYHDKHAGTLYLFQPQPASESDGAPRPAFGHLPERTETQTSLFARRLEKRARHLRRWPTRQGIHCFRLYDRDIPEIPLVVDRYDTCLHITEYERPNDHDPAAHANWLDQLVATAATTLDVPPNRVFFKSRQRQRGNRQHQRVAQQSSEFEVTEGGLTFIINLSDYVDTGLFLDHRVTRAMIRDEAAGKRFLNLFAYTGSFSVYAAAGQAAQTTTIDLSPVYLKWAERNMQRNGFDGPQHRFVQSDAMVFLEGLDREPHFDLAVVDPPTFSNSKRTEHDWEVQSEHVTLLNTLLQRMPTGGVVYFSNNFRRFKFDADAIEATAIHEISNQTVPADFRNRRIHRCWRLVR